MRQWIVEHDRVPFAYIQAYPTQAWPQSHLTHLPNGTEAIDAFIGVPEMIGRGHGGVFLRAFAEMLIAGGAPAVAIDPDAETIARVVLMHAGFVGDDLIEIIGGQVVLMLFT